MKKDGCVRRRDLTLHCIALLICHKYWIRTPYSFACRAHTSGKTECCWHQTMDLWSNFTELALANLSSKLKCKMAEKPSESTFKNVDGLNIFCRYWYPDNQDVRWVHYYRENTSYWSRYHMSLTPTLWLSVLRTNAIEEGMVMRGIGSSAPSYM